MTTQPAERLTDEQLNEIENRAAHLFEYVTLPTEADQLAGVDVPALLAELRRVQGQRRFLIDQLAKRDAETGAADRKVREFLSGESDAEPEPETGTRPCGHDDYHDAHEWADRPGVWCPGIGYDEPAAPVS